jgi:hypothetical protein
VVSGQQLAVGGQQSKNRPQENVNSKEFDKFFEKSVTNRPAVRLIIKSQQGF